MQWCPGAARRRLEAWYFEPLGRGEWLRPEEAIHVAVEGIEADASVHMSISGGDKQYSL